MGKRAWEQALEEWRDERVEWERECERLRQGGHWKKDLPKAPKKPQKADVILAGCSACGDSDNDDDSNGEESNEGSNIEGGDGDGEAGHDGGHETDGDEETSE